MLKLITKEQLLIAAAEKAYRETLQELEAETIADCKALYYPSTERHNTIIESDWSNVHIPF